MAHHQSGRLQQAEVIYNDILKDNPRNTDALNFLGVLFHQTGKNEIAISNFEKAIKINPGIADYYNNCGIACRALKKNEKAIIHFEKAIALKPEYAEAHNNLGVVYKDLGRDEDAIACYQQALTIKPDYAEALKNLGIQFHNSGQFEEAIVRFEAFLAISPDDVDVLFNLARVLHKQGNMEEAIVRYNQVLSIKPDYAVAHNNLGAIFQAVGKIEKAVTSFEQALIVNPDYAEAYNNLGNVLHLMGRLQDAIASYEKAIALKPNYAGVYNNMGNVFKSMGRHNDAFSCYEKATSINPYYHKAYSNIFLALNYLPSTTNAALYKKSKAWAATLENKPFNNVFKNQPDDNRPLNIAYVSGDFSNHPVGYFISRVLSSHDSFHFNVTCYSNSERLDETTVLIKNNVKQWRNIAGLSDDEVSKLIKNDSIDILVDLSGHTGNNRLTLFSERAAPVQVTWLGYFATTGLRTMDYILADSVVLPAEEEKFYTEKVRRLSDSYLCFDLPKFKIGIKNPPVMNTGIITFGCFNNYNKINRATIELWAEIMNSVPGSQIFLKQNQYGDSGLRQSVYDVFAANNIENSRVILEGRSSRDVLLKKYQLIDLALDPFPFGGGTTTAECLWMGVPLITMKGDRWVGRVSESILRTIGMSEFVARNNDEYKQIAISLCNDIPQLKYLRSNLRKKLETSPICDGKKYTKNLESEYRSIWKGWCQSNIKKVKE